MTAVDRHYEFGKNWTRYVERNFNDERLEIAKRYMLVSSSAVTCRGWTFSISGAAAASIHWRLFGPVPVGSVASTTIQLSRGDHNAAKIRW